MWCYKSNDFNEEGNEDLIKHNVGFVYLITNNLTGKMYVGKKLFRWTRQKKLVASDWKTYWGSNDELKKDVREKGENNFTRDILHLCETKSLCSYLEAKEQILRDVLLFPEKYYNNWVMLKVTRRHLQRFLVSKDILAD